MKLRLKSSLKKYKFRLSFLLSLYFYCLHFLVQRSVHRFPRNVVTRQRSQQSKPSKNDKNEGFVILDQRKHNVRHDEGSQSSHGRTETKTECSVEGAVTLGRTGVQHLETLFHKESWNRCNYYQIIERKDKIEQSTKDEEINKRFFSSKIGFIN